MQLYSEEKDWAEARRGRAQARLQGRGHEAEGQVPAHRRHRELRGRWATSTRPAQFYDQVLELDPTLDKALDEAIELRGDKGDHEGVERLLKVELERATEQSDTSKMLETFDQLGRALQGQARLDGRGHRRLRGGADARPRQRRAERAARQALRERPGAVPRQGRRGAGADPASATRTSPTRTSCSASSTPRPSAPTPPCASARRSPA